MDSIVFWSALQRKMGKIKVFMRMERRERKKVVVEHMHLQI
jgi:hypothetical protein